MAIPMTGLCQRHRYGHYPWPSGAVVTLDAITSPLLLLRQQEIVALKATPCPARLIRCRAMTFELFSAMARLITTHPGTAVATRNTSGKIGYSACRLPGRDAVAPPLATYIAGQVKLAAAQTLKLAVRHWGPDPTNTTSYPHLNSRTSPRKPKLPPWLMCVIAVLMVAALTIVIILADAR